MYLLFAISLLSFLALIAASVVIARHARSSHKSTPGQQTFAQHLQAAACNRDSRQPRTLHPQTVRDVLAKKGWNQPRTQLSQAVGPVIAINEGLGNLTGPHPHLRVNPRNSSRFSKGY
jgi:hypothetical protein